ncbi:putative leucine-rich repeat-containing protein DDB_G0290503 [Bicyclus anynana]|uniref:Leucine-rich repeat-containing protein DDB_G0290503 n=1 Tax=Bicyclus anynana TaxID=110368 RepID=A0A6J1MRK0_BICAN|nr:putative leucine-rich repeat-containing protein DDB_G0290503 [Bicyclus anynana]
MNSLLVNLTKNALMIDFKKINEIPLKLVATCEQTLATRKDMIDWFENLKNHEQGCSKSSLSKKIYEFNAENEMLSCTLETVKNDFLNELNDILRTCINERIALQLRTEEFTCEISELNSQNTELKKQLYNAENQKSHINKIRIEELEKELKDEKVKKLRIRDHLSRAEGQLKIEADRAAQLEAALNQAITHTRSLERTIQQQQEQNQQLQKDFGSELNKLKESIKKNTNHIEDIATARETLQHENEDLKKKLQELTCHYNLSQSTMKEDLNKNIAKLIEVENRYNEELRNKEKLHKTVDSQWARLLEYESCHKDMLKKIQEAESTTNELMNYKKELERTKNELNEAVTNLEKYKTLNSEQEVKILGIEENLKISLELEKKIKTEISNKNNNIAELEERNKLLTQQLLENDCKMQTYEDQLSTLKSHLTKMHEHFIEYGNFEKIHEQVNRQNIKLAETKRKNDELSEELEKKQNNLKQVTELLTEHENLLKQRQSFLQSEKDKEQSNILRLNGQINEKNAEISSLITNIKTRKEQISQLEKIILTIEDQNRKCAVQKRKDHDKICALEQKIAEYEHYLSSRDPELPDNLDNLIKILEDELGTSYDNDHISSCFKQIESNYRNQNDSSYQPNSKRPAKIVMGNFVKKTYIPNNDDINNYRNDIDYPRKKAINSTDTQHCIPAPDAENSFEFMKNDVCTDGILQHCNHSKEKLSKKLQYILPKQMRDEKKSKMFKFASPRIT